MPLPKNISSGPNPDGICHCGCGQRTRIARSNDDRHGWISGQPVRFVSGHNGRVGRAEYIVDEATGCWNWQRSIDKQTGYGRVGVKKTFVSAHRVFYERAKGPIPKGLHIDHLCRNRRCVNPDHLEAVTCVVNVRRGANTQLTEDQITEIRSSFERGCVIAARLGISEGHVSNIRRRKRWAN